MFKFAKYFFTVFLITAILPLVLMFLWNNSQVQKMHALMSKNGLSNGTAKLEENLKNNLSIQEGEILKKLYYVTSNPVGLREIKNSLKDYSIKVVPKPVAMPVSFYESQNDTLISCTLLPFAHKTNSLKICKPVDIKKLRPSGPYNIELRFEKAQEPYSYINIATDPMSIQYFDKKTFLAERLFKPKANSYSNLLEIKNENNKTIAYINISLAFRQSRMQIDNILTGLIILIIGIISSFIIGMIVKKVFVLPIMALSNATKEIEKGNLNFRLTNTNNQELIQNIYNSFNDMAENLETKENLRQSFISNLTHDLRTPLVSQAQSLELISQKFKEIGLQNEYELAESLAKNNEHLLKMVNLILESYSFDSKKLRLNIEKVDLYKIISDCTDKLKPLIEDKKIQVINNIYQGGTQIDADLFQLTRVFMNLLSNAIENTKENDYIKINAHYNDSDVIITIEDNGNGIAPEDLKFIFDRYYSGKSLERKLGSGFGLSVCEKLVSMHNGTINVESEINKYTRFTIKLPQNQNKEDK